MKLLAILKDKFYGNFRSLMSTKNGFTLIEVIVVITLVSFVGGLGLYFGFDNFSAYSFHANRDTLVGALQHARSQAMANTCHGDACSSGKPFGVKIKSDYFIIFEGGGYTEDSLYNIKLEANSVVKHTGISEIVFEQLTGNASSPEDLPEPWEMVLTDTANNRNSVITINKEGQILWTN